MPRVHILEHSGSTHHAGDHTMLPFLVDMARLYELFVAEWLKTRLPKGWSVESQERVHFLIKTGPVLLLR